MKVLRVKSVNGDTSFQNETIRVVKREIYLTFDDGIEAGTKEVLELLRKKEVRATFFLIGKKIESAYKRNRKECLEILQEIKEKHCIGNHSYSHANDRYSEFYREGGVQVGLDKEGKAIRSSVVEDFKKSLNVINYYLNLSKVIGESDILMAQKKMFETESEFPMAKKQNLLRFPGSNTWFVSSDIKDIKKTGRGNEWWKISEYKEDTKEEAEALYKEGYKIFGWDCEWEMKEKPRIIKETRNYIAELEKNKKMDYNDIECIDPYFNLYSSEYIEYDRPLTTLEKMKEQIRDKVYHSPIQYFDDKGKVNGKVVVLMHERQFRIGKLINGQVDMTNTEELDKLEKLIDYFKSINANFKTLDEY